MTIRFTCPECGVPMKIKDELAGKSGKCPKCKAAFVVPPADIPEDEPLAEDEAAEEEWDEEEDEDEFLDMPLEVTAAPVEAPPEMPPASRDRKGASETKKATRIKPKKKSAATSDGFDPTDVLFEDEASAASAAPATPALGSTPNLAEDDAPAASSMAAMFKDFTPAGGRRKETPTANSTNVAAELLARKQEEKQKKNNQAASPYETASASDDAEGSELVEQLTDFVKEFGLYVALGIAAIIGVYFGMSYMIGGSSDVPDLTAVYGTVTRTEGSTAMLQITFTPINDTLRLDAETIDQGGGSAYTNNEGEYEAVYNGGHKGLPPGKYEVGVFDNGRKLLTKEVEIKDGQGALNMELK